MVRTRSGAAKTAALHRERGGEAQQSGSGAGEEDGQRGSGAGGGGEGPQLPPSPHPPTPPPPLLPWEKVLWRRQPYPDNHTDATFLQHMVTGRRGAGTSLSSAVHAHSPYA